MRQSWQCTPVQSGRLTVDARFTPECIGVSPVSQTEKLLLDRPEAAALIGVKPSTLRRWYARGEGPPAMKLGEGMQAPVRYARDDVRRWIDAGCPMQAGARPLTAPKGKWSPPRGRDRRQCAGREA
jgi:predicted DNA-binding transcriptional regulator AlpA